MRNSSNAKKSSTEAWMFVDDETAIWILLYPKNDWNSMFFYGYSNKTCSTEIATFKRISRLASSNKKYFFLSWVGQTIVYRQWSNYRELCIQNLIICKNLNEDYASCFFVQALAVQGFSSQNDRPWLFQQMEIIKNVSI